MNRTQTFKRMTLSLCLMSSLLITSAMPANAQTDFLEKMRVERNIDILLSQMTLDEKLGQLNQLSGEGERGIRPEQRELVRKGAVGSFLNVVSTAATREVQRIAVQETRLKIPLIFGLDVIHGYRTIFPVPLAEASTWNPELVEKAARVAAIEATAAGVQWTFAPMVDIARDPRWGRIVEGSGEDPYLGSLMAAARVRGFQGATLESPGSLLACAKHYAAYGGAEAGKDYNTADISERTLREIYLPPFRAAVKAGAGTLMSSFNEIGGIPSTANPLLLTKILRGEWGFGGFVVSDWGAIEELVTHGIAATRAEAGVRAIKAGVDMDMQGLIYKEDLPAEVREGRLAMDDVDRAVRRVLRMKFQLGLFANPYKNCDSTLEQTMLLTPEHRSLALTEARQAIVLLKNEGNTLPLTKNIGTIALIGPLANNREELLGAWAAKGKSEDAVTVLDGIKKKLSSAGKILYAKGCEIDSSWKGGFDEARRAASKADAVVLVMGEAAWMSGEAASRSNLGLPGVQEDLVREMQKTGKPVVVVLMNGRPLTIPWVYEQIPAVLESWYLGIEAGNAVADVLFGDVNPSGKLPVTIPRSVGQIPLYYNHKNTGRPASESHYTSKYIDGPVTPQYPFGYGIGYSKFTYRNLALSSNKIGPSDSLRVTVQVQNNGTIRGEEVVQLYVRDLSASVTRPVKELKGLRRIMLKPAEQASVRFVLPMEDLSFLDDQMKSVVEPGKFRIFVGGNSEEVLEQEFEVIR
ncbi:MAG: beta-glucosidase BglX [Bacteroidota bacterium]